MKFEVRRAKKGDAPSVFKMARTMWPDVRRADIFIRKYVFYVAEDNGKLVGFIMLTARRDYVEGTTTSPVGYVEGLYVEDRYRKQSVGRYLVKAAEQWCVQKGLKELGSDVELHNKVSQQFHKKVGFTRGELIVPYVKKVRSAGG